MVPKTAVTKQTKKPKATKTTRAKTPEQTSVQTPEKSPEKSPEAKREKKAKVPRSLEKKLDKQWMKMFRTAEPTTDTDALLYLSRIAYIAISQYLFYRGLVPLGVVEKRRIAGRSFDLIALTLVNLLYILDYVHIFTFCQKNADGSVNRWGTKLSEMMRGMSEAIQKKYARQIILMINEDLTDPDLATETFVLTLTYDNGDCVSFVE